MGTEGPGTEKRSLLRKWGKNSTCFDQTWVRTRNWQESGKRQWKRTNGGDGPSLQKECQALTKGRQGRGQLGGMEKRGVQPKAVRYNRIPY